MSTNSRHDAAEGSLSANLTNRPALPKSLIAGEDGWSGNAAWGQSQWMSEGVQEYPVNAAEFQKPLPELIDDWVLAGHAPEQALLSQDDTVMTLGSCFALHLGQYLKSAGFGSANFWVPSGLNNTFALLDFVHWCTSGQITPSAFRYERNEAGEIEEWTPTAEQESYREHFERAGAFVFTIGLAEVWEDSQTGKVFWRGVPKQVFDENRHVFRLSTVEENVSNLLQLVKSVRTVNQQAPIIFTLSPVPLRATFRDISCVTADCVSKSVLRVAINETLSTTDSQQVYYWPSFEIVKWVGCHVKPVFGDDGNSRHVNNSVVRAIVGRFIRNYYGEQSFSVFEQRMAGDLVTVLGLKLSAIKHRLTESESQVALLKFGEGLTVPEIAAQLGISSEQAESHLRKIHTTVQELSGSQDAGLD